MRRLALAIAIAAFVVAGTASAAGPKTFTENFRLPKPKQASVYELHVKITGVSIKGVPFFLSATNQAQVPSYIRAAYQVIQKGPGSWDVFVGINAPKGLVPQRKLSGGATTLDVSLQVPPTGPATVTVTGSTTLDECHQWLKDHPAPFGMNFFRAILAGSDSEAEAVMAYVRKADTHCK